MTRILITGGMGLIGRGLIPALETSGFSVDILDIRGNHADGTFGDIRNPDDLASKVAACDGIVHLAAVSRVIWGERDPPACWKTNVDGLRNVLQAAAEGRRRPPPWIVLSSSREVYGQADRLPVHEDAPLNPVNVYARSKVAAEALMEEARAAGLKTAVTRLSNVYGSTCDHPDRVVPAFASAAASGGGMKVEGDGNLLDFTWRDDVCNGIAIICELMAREAGQLPPIHFVSGRGTRLLELAQMAQAVGGGGGSIRIGEPRSYDVSSFRGDPSRAEELLGWRATTPLEEGLRRLVEAYRSEAVIEESQAEERRGASLRAPADG